MPVVRPLEIFAVVCCAAALTADAEALIVYGSGPNDVDNTQNTEPSGTAAPWDYVATFGVNNATGVYLGNGFVLTAHHAGTADSGIVIQGVSYSRDTAFAPLHVTQAPDVADLKLVKILGNPALPDLAPLPLNFSTADLNAGCTLIAAGVGKGAVVANQGWTWGGDATRARRWGTNQTLAGAVTTSYDMYSYEALRTRFQRSLGANTAHPAWGDSGGALFQNFGGVWKLSGLVASLQSALAQTACYDGNTILPGDQPDTAFYVRLRKYAPLLRYENWAEAKLGSATADPSGDPDRDGLCNLLEYALGGDPLAPSAEAVPRAGREEGYVTLTYTRLMSATDIVCVVEESDDLLTWQPAEVSEEVLAPSGVVWTIKARVAVPPGASRFLRLRVTKL